MVTRAGKGMSLMRRGEAAKHFPGRAREVFDVSGAGDTVIAVLAGLALLGVFAYAGIIGMQAPGGQILVEFVADQQLIDRRQVQQAGMGRSLRRRLVTAGAADGQGFVR